MGERYAVVDLFAGPGGLAEGFSSVKTEGETRVFEVVMSVEKEAAAHSTLRLRAFLRQFGDSFPQEYYDFLATGTAEPDWATLYPAEWEAASDEALYLELGTPEAEVLIDRRLDAIRDQFGDRTVLIGGPPCQAYSLVGRARNQGKSGYEASADNRHFLYREYIRILRRLRPAVFVMENVKGMLSAKVDGESIFDQVVADLRESDPLGGYDLFAVAPAFGNSKRARKRLDPRPEDFVVRAERFGLPQARHRVIILGIRRDLKRAIAHAGKGRFLLREAPETVSVNDVLGELPDVRSGLSGKLDDATRWSELMAKISNGMEALSPSLPDDDAAKFVDLARTYSTSFRYHVGPRDRTSPGSALPASCPSDLKAWLGDSNIRKLPNHETRGHMSSDLERYMFAAIFGEATGRSPKASDFPAALAPAHQNWASGKFADRFRVQIGSLPSTTITSHISKDGHYFIHPDPLQCRSLTVREAARLQTFPDNYFFKGNRTQQFIQVGNAVPPFLAFRIGQLLRDILLLNENPDLAVPEEASEEPSAQLVLV